MRKSRFTESQIVQILAEHDAGAYNVTTKVVTELEGVDPKLINTISISQNSNGNDHFHVDQVNNHMIVGAGDPTGWGYAHEAGHLMGLQDAYDSVKTIPLEPHQLNPNYGYPLPGRKGDIMAQWGGVPTSLDIRLILENLSNVHS